MGDFCSHLPLYTWVSSEVCHRLLLQLQTSQEFWVVSYFLPLTRQNRYNGIDISAGGATIPVKENDLSSNLLNHYIPNITSKYG